MDPNNKILQYINRLYDTYRIGYITDNEIDDLDNLVEENNDKLTQNVLDIVEEFYWIISK
jgi:hypothetical protein